MSGVGCMVRVYTVRWCFRGVGFCILGLGFRAGYLGTGVGDGGFVLEVMVGQSDGHGVPLRAQGVGCRVQGSGFRV